MVKVDLKVALVGYQAVGKTTLVNRFLDGVFDGTVTYKATIGALFNSKIIEVNGTTLNMGIWDIGGDFRWEKQVNKCCSDANAVIVCYNSSEMESFKIVRFWQRELKDLPAECRVYLCATKSDLLHPGNPTTPDLSNVENYAKMMNAKFFLTSSKTGENIVKMFEEIVSDYLSNSENVRKMKKFEEMEQEETVYCKRKQSSQSDHNNCSCFSWIWRRFKYG